ncbi:MAG: hypothetical protein MUF52_08870 [Syntrophobacteraceae bacterium]|nr:hypothetical protein [Syntrophobacteraceae bacterium]
MVDRWFCGRPEPSDALRLTEILICDGFVIGETLATFSELLLGTVYQEPFRKRPIQFKGELRDTLCGTASVEDTRVLELFAQYRQNPDFYYREAPINGVLYLDSSDQLLGLFRVKRPRRIAEKANRKLANWIFETVQDLAHHKAEERAWRLGIPLDALVTPEMEMIQEFIDAEKEVARAFRECSIRLDRAALNIADVGGLKIIADPEKMHRLETIIDGDPTIRIHEKDNHTGSYQAKSMIVDVLWDPEHVCRRFLDQRSWAKYLNRGIPEERLKKGLEPLMGHPKPNLRLELILATFPDMVESELGTSIHEERIIAQRDNKIYRGYIPTNVEFLIGYLFGVGFSPKVEITEIPFKLWGRYLPDTLISHTRRLHDIPEYDLLY